jgi:hypothetical protein
MLCLLTGCYIIVSRETAFKFYCGDGCSNMFSFMLISVLIYIYVCICIYTPINSVEYKLCLIIVNSMTL